jgi:hypothetical protein
VPGRAIAASLLWLMLCVHGAATAQPGGEQCAGYQPISSVRGYLQGGPGAHVRAFIGRLQGVPADRDHLNFRVIEPIVGRFHRSIERGLLCTTRLPRQVDHQLLGVLVDDSMGGIRGFVVPSVLRRAARPFPAVRSRGATRFIQVFGDVVVGLDVHGVRTASRSLGVDGDLEYDGGCPGGHRILLGSPHGAQVARAQDLRTVLRLTSPKVAGSGICVDPLGRTLLNEYEAGFDPAIHNVIELEGRIQRRLTTHVRAYVVRRTTVFFTTANHPRTVQAADGVTGLVRNVATFPVAVQRLDVSSDDTRLLGFTADPFLNPSVPNRLITYDLSNGRWSVSRDQSQGTAVWIGDRVCWAVSRLTCTRPGRSAPRLVSTLAGTLYPVARRTYLVTRTGGIYLLDPALRPHLLGFTPDPLEPPDALGDESPGSL